jgi:hypothetical protein
MRFTSILSSGLIAGLAAAAPTPAANELVTRGPVDYQLTAFTAQSFPLQKHVIYSFGVTSNTKDAARDFGTAECRVELKSDSFVPVTMAQCQADNGAVVYFSMTRYAMNGDYAGWNLQVTHTYHDDDGALSIDVGSYKVPTDQIVTEGENRDAHKSILIQDQSVMIVKKQ